MKNSIIKAFATRTTAEFNDYLGLMPNPDLLLQKKNLQVTDLSELLYDPHLSSCVQSRKAGVHSLEWEVTNDEGLRFEIEDMLKKIDLYQVISDILEAPLYGYKPLEVFWRYDDGKLVVKDIVGKPPEWFSYDDLNLLKFLHKDFQDGVYPPHYKIVVARHGATYDNPYGQSMLSRCFWAWFIKKEAFKHWMTFTEKYGMPYLIGKMIGTPSQDALDEYRDALVDMASDGVIVLPEDKTMDQFSTGGGAASTYEQLINFCNAEISKTVLSQTLTTEQGDKGTQALGTVHLQVRQDVIDADKRLVENVMNKIIRWYVDINYGDAPAPKFVMFEDTDIEADLAARDATLIGTGQIKFTKNYWKKHYGFKDSEFEMVTQDQPLKALGFSEQEPPQYKALDQLEKSVKTLLKPIVEMVQAGKSYDEIQTNLIELFPNLETDEIENLIAQGLLASSVHGILDVQ